MKPGRKLGIAEARYVGVKGLATVIDSFLRAISQFYMGKRV